MFDMIGLGAINVDTIYQVPSLDVLSLEDNIVPGSELVIEQDQANRIQALLNDLGILKTRSVGGQATNTISALNNMGYSVALVGAIGRDDDGEFLVKGLSGIDVSNVMRKGTSGQCISVLSSADNNDRICFVVPNANNLLMLDSINISFLNQCQILHFSSFVKDQQLKMQIDIAERLSEDVMISMDIGELYAAKGLDKLYPLLSKVQILFATDEELKLITGIKEVSKACKAILRLGPRIAVCKFGAKGSGVFTATGNVFVKALQIEAVDSTGAGDVYAAGFLAGYINNLSLIDCARLANQAAAFSLSGYGHENYPDKAFHDYYLGVYHATKA